MADACASIAGFFGLCIYSALTVCCDTHPFGADACCCGGPRRCCGSCCDSFNEDDFDERLKKQQAKNGANTGPVDSQPAPSHDMSVAGAGDPKPANGVEEVR